MSAKHVRLTPTSILYVSSYCLVDVLTVPPQRYSAFGPSIHDTLTPQEADIFCNDTWNHYSWTYILSLLGEVILGVLFSAIAFAYYRQSLDPTSAANAFRAPSNQMRGSLGGAYPQYYNPPYNTSASNLAYGAGPTRYAPPPGPPPAFGGAGYNVDDAGKPPGYDGGDYVGGFGAGKDSKDDPFADFEGDRDVGDRPKPGEHDGFHV
jgi:hypothetical protein